MQKNYLVHILEDFELSFSIPERDDILNIICYFGRDPNYQASDSISLQNEEILIENSANQTHITANYSITPNLSTYNTIFYRFDLINNSDQNEVISFGRIFINPSVIPFEEQ